MPRPVGLDVAPATPRSGASTNAVGRVDRRRCTLEADRWSCVPDPDEPPRARPPESAAIEMSPSEAVGHPPRERKLLRRRDHSSVEV